MEEERKVFLCIVRSSRWGKRCARMVMETSLAFQWYGGRCVESDMSMIILSVPCLVLRRTIIMTQRKCQVNGWSLWLIPPCCLSCLSGVVRRQAGTLGGRRRQGMGCTAFGPLGGFLWVPVWLITWRVWEAALAFSRSHLLLLLRSGTSLLLHFDNMYYFHLWQYEQKLWRIMLSHIKQ